MPRASSTKVTEDWPDIYSKATLFPWYPCHFQDVFLKSFSANAASFSFVTMFFFSLPLPFSFFFNIVYCCILDSALRNNSNNNEKKIFPSPGIKLWPGVALPIVKRQHLRRNIHFIFTITQLPTATLISTSCSVLIP